MTYPTFTPWSPVSDLSPEDRKKALSSPDDWDIACVACNSWQAFIDKESKLCRECWRVVVLGAANPTRWHPRDLVGLMDRQIVSVECSRALAPKFLELFPADKVRVIDRAMDDFWAIITTAEPFVNTPPPERDANGAVVLGGKR